MNVEVSVNLDLLYTDLSDDVCRRAVLAAQDGVRHVEIWHWSNKDIAGLAAATRDHGLGVCSMLLEPRTSLSTATDLRPFHDGLNRSADAARRLGCPLLVLSSEVGDPAVRRADQHSRVVDVLVRAGELLEGSGVKLALENVNTRVDHPGVLLDLAEDCAEVVARVDSPNVVLLVDLYHSLVMREDPARVLEAAGSRIAHVQVAGVLGRAELRPGPANPWPSLVQHTRAAGYQGPIGLEYFPSMPSRDSLALVRQALDQPIG